MKSYYCIEEMRNRDIYSKFIHYMLHKSDAFSLVYFQHNKKEALKSTVKEIQKKLKPLLIYIHNGNSWPGMMTLNMNKHIYNIALYKADLSAESILSSVDNIFEWDYPGYPMDLCFYREGYGWLAACSHENNCYLFTDDKSVVNDLEKLGVNISYCGEIEDSMLFFDEKAK